MIRLEQLRLIQALQNQALQLEKLVSPHVYGSRTLSDAFHQLMEVIGDTEQLMRLDKISRDNPWTAMQYSAMSNDEREHWKQVENTITEDRITRIKKQLDKVLNSLQKAALISPSSQQTFEAAVVRPDGYGPAPASKQLSYAACAFKQVQTASRSVCKAAGRVSKAGFKSFKRSVRSLFNSIKEKINTTRNQPVRTRGNSLAMQRVKPARYSKAHGC